MNSEKNNQNYSRNENKSYNEGTLNVMHSSSVIDKNNSSSENHLLFRLHEMEKSNFNLKNIIEQQTIKIAEIHSKNTKSITIIAHDLRSPFNSIIGSLEVIKRNLAKNNTNMLDKFIDIAKDSAFKTLNLLDTLLEWTISRNNGKSICPVSANLHKLIAEEIENTNISAIQKHIAVHLSISQDLNLYTDLQMVKTVFRNLIGNAIKYSNIGGEIIISAYEKGQFAEICVKDNGIGISAKSQKDLFIIDEFNSTAGTSNELGTGLGLLLCKEFIEQHGGSIWIKSEPEKGSEFIFTLPLETMKLSHVEIS